MSEHAVLAPSGAPFWAHCSGYISACKEAPLQESTEHTILGEAVHELLATVLSSSDSDCSVFLGQYSSNGVLFGEEEVECAQIYVDSVREEQAKHQISDLLVEQRVRMPQIHLMNWGTLDASLYVPQINTVFLWEYKHGRSPVSAYRNYQSCNYALGVCNHYGIKGPTQFVITVVQPRAYRNSGPVDRWVTNMDTMSGIWTDLRVAAHKAMGSSPKLSAGKHCRNCPAVGICAAAKEVGYNAFDYLERPYEIDRMADRDLGIEYELVKNTIKMLEDRRDALEDSIIHRMQEPMHDTGMVYEPGRSKWVWKVPPEDAITFVDQFGVDARKNDVKTVAQVRKQMPKADRDMFDVMRPAFAEKRKGKNVLTTRKDSISRRVFGNG